MASPAMSTAVVVSKGRFARLKNVSGARVSQWIKEGKIGRDALVGEGRMAKINVVVATLQLRGSLDVNQSTGANGIGTKLDLPAASPPTETAQIAPTPAPATDQIAEQIKQQKLDLLRRANRREAEEEASRAGRYIETADAVRQLGTVTSQMMSVVEGSMTELATAISAQFQVPQRDVLHLLRAEFRKVRAAGSKMFREKELELPELIEARLDQIDGVVCDD